MAGTITAMLMSFLWSGPAQACPGNEAECAGHGEHAEKKAVDPSHCAKKVEWVKGACSYSTGMMAERVLSEGTPYSFVGRLKESDEALESRVAAPFLVGPKLEVHLVANAVLDNLGDVAPERVRLSGKLLKVNGITYMVATTAEPSA